MSINCDDKLLKIRISKETDRPYHIKEYIRLGDEKTHQYIIGDVVKGNGHFEVNCYLNKNNIEEGIRLLYANSHFDAVQIATMAVKENDPTLEHLANILPKSQFRSEIERRVKEKSSKPE